MILAAISFTMLSLLHCDSTSMTGFPNAAADSGLADSVFYHQSTNSLGICGALDGLSMDHSAVLFVFLN